MRELFNLILSQKEIPKEVLEKSLKLLHPFCPHITEELWEKIGGYGFISISKWPEVDEQKISDKYEKEEENLRKIISDINHVKELMKEKKDFSKAFIYVLPNEKEFYDSNQDIITKKTSTLIKVTAVNDENIYDPEKKAKKVKPGKPGIYLE